MKRFPTPQACQNHDWSLWMSCLSLVVGQKSVENGKRLGDFENELAVELFNRVENQPSES